MSRARVLVVDDSAVIRRMLTDVLASDPAIEVVGTAGNGEIALAKLAELRPDLMTLDIEMPGMSGLDLLVEIRKRAPKLPVVMFSTLTQRAAATTLEALARGATDYVTKPSNTGSREASIEHVRSQLVPRIKALASVAPPIRTAMPVPAPTKVQRATRLEVVAVASSTGGPNALAELLAGITRPLPVPMVVVQHMPPVFTKILADRLTASSTHRVYEAMEGMTLEPGHVYIAAGDHHLKLAREGRDVRVVLDHGPHENSVRPAADVTFRSVATAYGGNVLAVVLTGMGQDGLRGVEVLRPLGAQVLVQDEASSVVWGMPGAVAQAGLADDVVPLAGLAKAIVGRFGSRQGFAHAG